LKLIDVYLRMFVRYGEVSVKKGAAAMFGDNFIKICNWSTQLPICLTIKLIRLDEYGPRFVRGIY
jgi:hypothetical protein